MKLTEETYNNILISDQDDEIFRYLIVNLSKPIAFESDFNFSLLSRKSLKINLPDQNDKYITFKDTHMLGYLLFETYFFDQKLEEVEYSQVVKNGHKTICTLKGLYKYIWNDIKGFEKTKIYQPGKEILSILIRSRYVSDPIH